MSGRKLPACWKLADGAAAAGTATKTAAQKKQDKDQAATISAEPAIGAGTATGTTKSAATAAQD